MDDDTAIGPPLFSVLIGRVSTVDGTRILETLAALRDQDVDFLYEVIVVDRLRNKLSRRIAQDFPGIRLIECDPAASLPEMRTTALESASGRYVAVTEDHCVPPSDWLRSFRDAFCANSEAVAIAGCVLNGVAERAFDKATFLCEYAAFLPPIREGFGAPLAGMNVSYNRESLLGLPRSLLTSGFWETTVHPHLHSSREKLVATNRVRIMHCKRFTFGLFVCQRFAYSRYYAGIRFPRTRRSMRLAAALATPLLPWLLMWRLLRAAGNSRAAREAAWRAAPFLFLFYVAWAAGESVGYLFGAGTSLREIE